jgi:hypothetical protein
VDSDDDAELDDDVLDDVDDDGADEDITAEPGARNAG